MTKQEIKECCERMDANKRTAERLMLWGMVTCLFSLALLAFMVSPALYIMVVGTLAAFGVFAGTIVAFITMLDAGPLGWIVAGDVLRVGFQIAIAILQASVGVSGGSSD